MDNIQTYIKQITGEINPGELAKASKKIEPDLVVPYYAFVKPYVDGIIGFVSYTNGRRKRPCNIELTFDGETKKLKNVRMINNEKA